jgi:integrase
VARNPFEGISQLKESRQGEIVYCTPEERETILSAADGLPNGIAVWLAFYTGMRRGEVWRLRWQDVSLDRSRLSVQQTKTGRGRVVPLAVSLADRLRAVGPGVRGVVVPRQPGCGAVHAAAAMLDALRAACPKIPHERISWNTWRHTFGSLLAQQGVGLDKISAWMGNSPEICRRHYAQFVPRGRHDEDIELL